LKAFAPNGSHVRVAVTRSMFGGTARPGLALESYMRLIKPFIVLCVVLPLLSCDNSGDSRTSTAGRSSVTPAPTAAADDIRLDLISSARSWMANSGRSTSVQGGLLQ
jgi:hypothetical protein